MCAKKLSKLEIRTLDYCANGYTAKEIAKLTNLHPRT